MSRLWILVGGVVLGLLIATLAGTVVVQKFRERVDRWERPRMSASWSGTENGPVVAFMGASITADWPLAEAFPDYRILNAGAGFNFAGHELLRFEHDVLAHQPNVIVIKACAINLIPSGFGLMPPVDPQRTREALAMMVGLTRSRGAIPVLCTPVPVGQSWIDAHGGATLAAEFDDLSAWIRQYCLDEGVLMVDYASEVAGDDGRLPASMSPDGLHVNGQGYAEMVRVLRPVLQRAVSANATDADQVDR